jgi:hypothetical protein
VVVSVTNDTDSYRLPCFAERETRNVRLMSVAAGTDPRMLRRVEIISLFRNYAAIRPNQLDINMHRLHELMRLGSSGDIEATGCLMRSEAHNDA